jgi:hypothetical protein
VTSGSRIGVFAAVALAVAILGFRLTSAGIASGYIDPVARHGVQDEAVYGRSAINMAQSGEWLTPRFLDRLMLNKPPLLHWLGAASTAVFGPSRLALRLVPLIAGVTVCLLTFLWVRREASTAAGFCAVLLLLENPTFHFTSRRFVTDAPLLAWFTGAMFLASRDPGLERRRTAIGIGICAGLAMMTKSVAGVLPLAAIFFAGVVTQRGRWRASSSSFAISCVTAVAVAAPWHVYEAFAHRYWFEAEYFGEQLARTGSTIPLREAVLAQVAFYGQRLWASDQILCLAFVAGVAMAIFRLWKRVAGYGSSDSLALLFAWFLVGVGALTAFRFQAMSYATILLPAMAMLATIPSRWLRMPCAWGAPALLAGILVIKVFEPSAPWRLDYGRGSTIPSAPALSDYCRLARGNELVIVAPDDEMYGAILDLPFVRYAVYIPAIDEARVPPFMRRLGLVLRAAEWYGDPQADYAACLREAGLESSRAVGTLLVIETDEDLGRLVEASPRMDFNLPKGLLDSITPEQLLGRDVRDASADRAWLFGEPVARKEPPTGVCAL